MLRAMASIAASLVLVGSATAADITLLNVSYDPTRELYAEFNKAFAAKFQADAGKSVEIKQSHGGSGRQARSVIDGLAADVVTLALAYDVDEIADRGLLAARLAEAAAAERFALHVDHRVPGAQGQPEEHQGLGRSGEAGHQGHHAESEDVGRGALELPRRLGLRTEEARRQRGQGQGVRQGDLCQRSGARYRRARIDHHVRRARRRRRASSRGRTRPSSPSTSSARTSSRSSFPRMSILAEPPVAVVDKVVDKKGTRAAAEAYLNLLYSKEGQEIAAKHYYRPRDPDVAKKYETVVPEGRALHHRRRVRRLARRAEEALRRQGRVRRDL